MKFIYPALFHKEDGSYWVEFPDLEGCQSFGDTLEETMDNAKEALEGYCIAAIENDIKIPKARDIKSIKTGNDEFSSLICADISAYLQREKAVKKTLTIPSWLNDKANEKGINFSLTLQNALLDTLGIGK